MSILVFIKVVASEEPGARRERLQEFLWRAAEKKDETRMKLTRDEWFSAGRWMGLFLTGVALGLVASAQAVSTTAVQGTVYLANGQAGAGTLNVSWPAFTTANGQAIAAGHVM